MAADVLPLTPAALLASLRSRGVRLWLASGGPRLDPAAALTPGDWEALRASRADLIVLLESEREPVLEWATLPDGRRCLLILYSEADRAPAMREVNFFDPTPPTTGA